MKQLLDLFISYTHVTVITISSTHWTIHNETESQPESTDILTLEIDSLYQKINSFYKKVHGNNFNNLRLQPGIQQLPCDNF